MVILIFLENESLILPSAQFWDDDGHRPAGELHQGAQEVGLNIFSVSDICHSIFSSYLVNISLSEVARVLNMAVVTHEAHHAKT